MPWPARTFWATAICWASVARLATEAIGSTAQLVAALYQAGARVAVHSTISDAGQLVAAGVDSIEHGIGMDANASANSSAATSSARSVSPKTRTRPPASASSRRPSSRPSRPPHRLRPDARAGALGQYPGCTRRNRRSPGSWQASRWCPASITTALAPVAYRPLDLRERGPSELRPVPADDSRAGWMRTTDGALIHADVIEAVDARQLFS